jgi:hypothetical protein
VKNIQTIPRRVDTRQARSPQRAPACGRESDTLSIIIPVLSKLMAMVFRSAAICKAAQLELDDGPSFMYGRLTIQDIFENFLWMNSGVAESMSMLLRWKRRTGVTRGDKCYNMKKNKTKT